MEPEEIVNIKENLTLIEYDQIDFTKKKGPKVNKVNRQFLLDRLGVRGEGQEGGWRRGEGEGQEGGGQERGGRRPGGKREEARREEGCYFFVFLINFIRLWLIPLKTTSDS